MKRNKIIQNIIIALWVLYPITTIISQTSNPCDGKGNQHPLPKPKPEVGLGDAASMSLIMNLSVDPNELEGPMGVDSVRWVSKNDVLNYTVFFENDPAFATAHAQIVDIRIDLPYEQLLNDFTLGTYAFANKSYEVPNESNFYSIRLDTRDSLDIYVDVLAGLDVDKKQAFWRLSSIDPESGHAPWQVDKGILPVNDSTHVGEGFVTFRLKPFEEMQTGDSIAFHANIVFDSNDTLQTNRWSNIIDAGAPTSKIRALVDQENYSHYMLSFEAEDDLNGCGVNKVLLYLADNLGTYEEYATCAVDSVLDFYVERGKQYSFMSIAEDRVGNREEIKSKPDLILNFNEPPTDIILSNNRFQDDIALDGFIGELSTIDSEGETIFTYELAEGEGAIHNDMFEIKGSQLIANDCFKCSNETEFSIRLSTTDEGGLTFSKPFKLYLERVLEQPEPVFVNAEICEGDYYEFFGEEYDKPGEYFHRVANEFMCDSVYTLNLRVKPIPEPPTITIKNGITLVSSAVSGNLWFKDGEMLDLDDVAEFTPSESGIYCVALSNGTCYSQQSEKYIVNFDEESKISMLLPKGWSWISTNIDEEYNNIPKNFFSNIIDDVEYIIGENGDVDVLSPGSMYKLKMQCQAELNVVGKACIPDDISQTLQKGWNWIGFLPTSAMTLEDALRNLNPYENDVIKGFSSFAVYNKGKWKGTLQELSPGCGYKYFSQDNNSFYYPCDRITKLTNENTILTIPARQIGSYWNCDEHDYSDNMTLIAQVVANGSEVVDGSFLIAAFCGNECRGIGEYIDNKLFMTIHGNADDFNKGITFKALENATGNICKVKETCLFNEDGYGTYESPLQLTIGESTEMAQNIYSESFSLYPNPVKERLFIDGDEDAIMRLTIFSISGIIVKEQNFYDRLSGIDVSSLIPGNYICGICTNKGLMYKKFIKH